MTAGSLFGSRRSASMGGVSRLIRVLHYTRFPCSVFRGLRPFWCNSADLGSLGLFVSRHGGYARWLLRDLGLTARGLDGTALSSFWRYSSSAYWAQLRGLGAVGIGLLGICRRICRCFCRLFWAVLESGYFGILDFGDFGAFGTEFGGLGPSGQACGLEAGNEAYEKRMT